VAPYKIGVHGRSGGGIVTLYAVRCALVSGASWPEDCGDLYNSIACKVFLVVACGCGCGLPTLVSVDVVPARGLVTVCSNLRARAAVNSVAVRTSGL
jgi:hypothetical protein